MMEGKMCSKPEWGWAFHAQVCGMKTLFQEKPKSVIGSKWAYNWGSGAPGTRAAGEELLLVHRWNHVL